MFSKNPGGNPLVPTPKRTFGFTLYRGATFRTHFANSEFVTVNSSGILQSNGSLNIAGAQK
jgi:hypothetical protein